MTKRKNEIMTTERTGFLPMQQLGTESGVSSEMAGMSATFEHIRIPIGGATLFEMPGEDPEETLPVKEFTAVILHHHPMRAFYEAEYTGGSNPPDCGSFDGILGSGTPGGECDRCPLNAFGSGANGAKACKEKRRLFLLREGDMFPVLLTLPTGSLKEFSRYLMRILPRYAKSNAVLTRFSLAKAFSKTGIAYSKVQFRLERVLTEKEAATISPLVMEVKALGQTMEYGAEPEEHQIAGEGAAMPAA